MAHLIRQYEIDAAVAYHGFCFQESDDGDVPVPFPDDYRFGMFLNAFPGRLDVFSGGHTHTAAVTAQVWDGLPPQEDPADWDEMAEADYESRSGDVAVWSMGEGRQDDLITLADGSGPWRVGVCCTGRAEAERLCQFSAVHRGTVRTNLCACVPGQRLLHSGHPHG